MLKKVLLVLLTLALTACSAPSANTLPPDEPPQEQTEPVVQPEASPAPTVSEPSEPETPPAPTVPEPPEPDAVLDGLPDFVCCRYHSAGGWHTALGIQPDGSFIGSHCNDVTIPPTMRYYNHIIRYCNFQGQFSDPKQVDEYTYSMTMESITLENTPGEESYSGETRYITSTPHGLEAANEVLLYFPGKKVSELPESFLAWSHSMMDWDMETETLPFYGLYNVEEGYGFVALDYYYRHNG